LTECGIKDCGSGSEMSQQSTHDARTDSRDERQAKKSMAIIVANLGNRNRLFLRGNV